MKRISTEAYQALRDALPVITWNKRPFETFIRTSLRDNPELLSNLNFADTKRAVADDLIDRLVNYEDKYQEVTLQFMLEIASMNNFSNLEQLKDKVDRDLRVREAEAAVAHLRSVTDKYSSDLKEADIRDVARKAEAAQNEALRRFADDLDALRIRFLDLRTESDHHARGYALESLLADLFLLFDLEPRLAYKIDLEQIDGSFSFETDDYILEARWRAESADRADGDVFAAKVGSKGPYFNYSLSFPNSSGDFLIV
ncbi:MAG: hypothetical protein ACRDRI_07735 [Pseudonocardiaceae bacterium]